MGQQQPQSQLPSGTVTGGTGGVNHGGVGNNGNLGGTHSDLGTSRTRPDAHLSNTMVHGEGRKNNAAGGQGKPVTQQQQGNFISPPNKNLPGTSPGRTTPTTPPNNNGGGTQGQGSTPSGIFISDMLSNVWNSTEFLKVVSPKIAFMKNVAFDGASKNSTKKDPDVFYVDVQPTRQYQVMGE